jgi:hypothetical protein
MFGMSCANDRRAIRCAEPGTALHERLVAGFGELGDQTLVWNIGPRQVAAFDALRDWLREVLEQRSNDDQRESS